MMRNPTAPQQKLKQVLAALQDNQSARAKQLCTALCKQHPGFQEAHSVLAQIHMNLGDFQLSADIYKTLLINNPHAPLLHYRLADAYKHAGELDSARIHFRKALQLNPGFAEACAGEASIFELKGDNDQAFHILSQFIEQNDSNPMVSLVYGKLCLRIGEPGKAVPVILKALNAKTIDRTNAGLLHFQAGHLYEALQHFDKAFTHFQEGNKLKNFNFDADSYKREIETITTTFTREALDNIPHSGANDENLIFIVGMMRSGTSLTEQILASHPKVHAAGELPYLGEVTSSFRNLFPNQQYTSLNPASLQKFRMDALAHQYLNKLGDIPDGKTFITDKMPFNFFRLQLIELLFPNARIVQCMRDPLDTCISCYCNDFVGEHSYAYDLANIGSFYNGYQTLMEHWKTTLRTPIMELRYEALVTGPDQTIKSLTEFCGLNWDENCLRFFDTDRFVNTASYDQVRKPLYTKSIGRWKNYKPYVSGLVKTLEM